MSQGEIRELYTEPLEKVSEEMLSTLAGVVPNASLVDSITASVQSAMIRSSLSLPHSKGKRNRKGRHEWSEEVDASYQKYIQAWRNWKASGEDKSSMLGALSTELKKAFRSKLRQSRAACRSGLLTKIEEANEQNDKLFYTLVKGQRTNSSVKELTIGEDTYSGSDIIHGWTRHFQDLSTPESHSSDGAHTLLSSQEEAPQGLEHLFTSTEMNAAISALKLGKASGPDNIAPEHLLHAGCTTRLLLLILMNWMVHLKHIPPSLKEGLVVPIHKGGAKDPSVPGNYRGITLTSVLAKLLELLLKPKLILHLKEYQIPDLLQSGFQQERSCTLTAKALDLVIELSRSMKQPLYVAMLDAQKAFDKVWQQGLLTKLESTQPAYTLLYTIAEFYKDCSSKVIWEQTVGPTFSVLQGVRQGGVLSPMLYTLYIDDLIKQLRNRKLGCALKGLYVGVLAFADDLALLSNDPSELQEMLEIAHQYTLDWRYKINPNKSAILVINGCQFSPDHLWHLDGKPVAEVSSHKHLGITRTCDPHYDHAADAITKGYRAFYALVGTSPCSSRVLPQVAAKLWMTFCVPRMLYGSSSVSFTKAMLTRLDKAQLHLFKRILGLPTSSADEAVYLLTDLLPISLKVMQEKLLLLGRILNSNSDRLEYRLLLQGICANTTTIQEWRKILIQLDLPSLDEMVASPVPYKSWKHIVEEAISDASLTRQTDALANKSSLALWTRSPKPKAINLYPGHVTNPSLRQSITFRAQLSCKVYLTQERLVKIGKASDDCCRLCHLEREDVKHLVATCPVLEPLRQDLVRRISSNPNTKSFGKFFQTDPQIFLDSVLFLPPGPMAKCTRAQLHTLVLILYYLRNLHSTRQQKLNMT